MTSLRSPDENENTALILEKVSKSFRIGDRTVHALKNVNARIRSGVVTGLIGPDGAGKTTLMRLASGLFVPDSGQITLLGMDVAREALTVQAAIGYMPQRFGLYEDLTVQENLDLYADLQGVPLDERPARYQEVMHMTGLGPFTRRLAGRLSGGMKQKLGLACTLIRLPRLLLLDEPTVGVDPVSRRELWVIVYRLVREEGMSVLLSTAYLDEAERCTEVILLHEGTLLGHGSPQDFSDKLRGQTFTVTAPDIKKRTLRERLAGLPGVVDAVIQGDHVRLVMDKSEPPALQGLTPAIEDAAVKPATPRFEDSFVATLKKALPRYAETNHFVEQPTADTLKPDKKPQAVIDVSHIQRRFGAFYAVKDVSFDVCQGEVFGLLGANGAGKSTTFRMLCGLLPASAGHLQVAGVDLRHAAAMARARIGYMSQKFALYGNLSVLQNLQFFSSAYNLSGKRRTQRINWALEQFELGPVSEALSIDLPLGYKQRLALACALMHEPDILFLDEPTSGVDPLARREFWQRINALAEHGVTVMVTTHFMEEAEYCDRLAIMAAGEILALGTPAQIKDRVRTSEQPEPTMEQAFIDLIEHTEQNAVNE